MKSIAIYILSMTCGCLMLASCADETDRNDKPVVADGIPVETMLSFQVPGADVMTKATEEEEGKVNDLYILAFDKQGGFLAAQYYDARQLAEATDNKVAFNTFTGDQFLYAAANVTNNSFTRNGEHLKGQIDAFTQSDENSLDDWKRFTAAINAQQVAWGDAAFLMTGFFAKDAPDGDELDGEGLCTIDQYPAGKGKILTEGRLQLVRSVAKVIVNIVTYNKSTSFEPTSWQVCNVPQSVFLNRQEGYGTPGGFFNTLPDKVFGNTFSFYMLENRQQARNERKEIKNTYDEADWREHPDNAPEHGTYIVIKGKYKGPEFNPFRENYPNVPASTAQATVTYFIHLGYVGSPDNYSIHRNHCYIYNVRVKSVNEIIVEAFTGKETYREDGDVIFSDAQVIDVDAHYQRIELALTPDDLQYGLAVQTAKTNFEVKDIAEIEGTQMDDVDWVLFMEKNAANSLPNGPVFTKGNRSKGLLNIRELAAGFRSVYPVGGTFYAYVAENYYDDLPTDQFVNFSATGAEQKARKMLISRRRKASPNSSVTSAKYIIKQKPITTIYNLEDAEVKKNKTFGIEWVNENHPVNYASLGFREKAAAGLTNGYGPRRDEQRGPSMEDGMVNTLFEFDKYGVRKWNNSALYLYENMQNSSGFVACMSRNRDENGNGTIDNEEIKWYLPAINQYQYIWTGTNVLPEDATLYPKEFRDNTQWEFYHYISSGGHVFWSEEGNAVGLDFYAGDSRRKYHVRCARNIGTGALIPVAEVTERNSDYIEINIKNRLNAASLRSIAQRQLGKHNEYEENNKLYKKFRVKQTVIPYRTWNELMDQTYGWENPCEKAFGSGWRVPNQRELILMTTVGQMTELDEDLPSATFFSFWDYNQGYAKERNPNNEERRGFIFNGDGKNIYLATYGNIGGSVRCVKDME